MKASTHRLVSIPQLALALAALLTFASAVTAQNRNQQPQTPGSPRPGDEQRPASIRERQFRMMEIEREAAQPVVRREEKIAYAQISEDFREIQVVNNKMLSVVIPAPEPDYSKITQTLTDIRKRAIRLKENLGFPEVDLQSSAKSKYKPASNIADLKANLLTLDESIMRFVKSPIFATPDVVDVKEGAKTRAEVEYIIATSQLISKDAERLKKSSKN